ncbi:aldose epimerase family protein [Leeuwenhoekiella sp. MAR_2009_132]|uniref:aldose epimerase family protein n=1 Tax=Leeuwenhoekiella sp. MAR_2009_132 TaxID=1392489 RepID=UPI00068B947D|nr:aldose epimerase family protein [Leeuwenhoekiella sp. MAR_2009_132]
MITIQPFDKTQDGRAVLSIQLKNASGMEAHFLSYGAILQKLIVPTNTGSFKDVVLGFEDLKSYEEDTSFIGQLVGRNANRIALGAVAIDGKKVSLSANEGNNQLHGGFESFGKKLWEVENLGDEVVFSYTSIDGEEGFPGNLKTQFFVKLQEDNELVMRFEAKTDKETIVNLTRHEYFNLEAGDSDSIKNHHLKINASHYLPKTPANVPSGELRALANTAFDLQKETHLKEAIAAIEGGYDHNYVLNQNRGQQPAAILMNSDKKLQLHLHCTQPGLQFYSANGMTNFKGKGVSLKGPSVALCLEPQHFPDTPNHENFPTTVLKPNAVYEHQIRYKFYYE